MRILAVDPAAPAGAALREAAALLRAGRLVAFPTETVYGLGGNALDPEAVRRIFAAKGRPSFNPLIAHVPSAEAARELAAVWPEAAERAAAAFWPGPLTLVVPRAPRVPDVVTAGLETVALRVPAHPVARALLEEVQLPLAAPSANRYTRLSPTTAAHVARGLGERVDLILDGGATAVGIESTVVDVSGDAPVLLRPGTLSRGALEEVLGPLRLPDLLAADAPRPSPGMVDRHYSPEAELRVYPPERRAELRAAAERARERAEAVGGLLLRGPVPGVTHPVAMPAEPAEYARELYAALHRLDEVGCALIVADAVPEGAEWAGVRDRLARAARRG